MEKFNTIYIEKSKLVDCAAKGDQGIKSYVESSGSDIDNFEVTSSVVVIGGGMSAEREVSFMSSNGIVDSLVELGHKIIFIDMGSDIAQVLAKLKPSKVFNALHGTFGEDGCLPGLLNIMRIPYTGCGVLSSAIAFNKKKSHEIFKANGIKVADSITVNKLDNIKADPMPRPYVIKPLCQGSSVGIEVIFAEDEFDFAEYNFPYGDEILVEQYIKGRELQVAVLNGKAIGSLEIKLLKGKRFYDYDVKYVGGFAEHLLPSPVSKDIYNKLLEISEHACKIFGCHSGIMRVEFIYSEEENELYMLEVNTHPGMTPLSICPEIVTLKGMSYTDLVEEVLKGAKFEE